MSAPNKSYDPRMVASLAPDEVARMLDEALAAFAAARTLDELKAARIAHDGDRAPLSLASGEIGALPPEARAEAGRRVGAARGRLRKALQERQDQLEAERDRQVLITEAVDVTLPGGRTPPGARHPVTMLSDRLSDVFVAMGYEVAEGPEAEAEWYNFDALNIPPDHPAREMQDTIFIAGQPPGGPGQPSADAPAGRPPPARRPASRAGMDPSRAWYCGRTPRRCRSGPCSLARCRFTWSARAAAIGTTPSMPRTARCSTRSRGWPWTRG